MRCARVALPILAALAGGSIAEEPMRFSFDCFANASEACFVIASGTLDGDAAARFEAFVDDPDSGVEGYQVLLDSPGGNFRDGMELGRRIRARQFHTVVGRADAGNLEAPVAAGECLSACAYAFLGGEGRRVPEGSRLGFHQFGLPGGAELPNAYGLAGGQEISGQLISYLIEMGVDARLFVLASATPSAEMVYPSPEQRLEFDIETPRGFDRFVLEPYGQGVIAASERLDPPRIYDQAMQLTAFCRDGAPRLMLTVPGVPAEPAGVDAELDAGPGTEPRAIGPDRVAVRESDQVAYFEVALTAAEAAAVVAAPEIGLSIGAPRVAGGPHWMRRSMSAMDRKAVAAAFRFCI